MFQIAYAYLHSPEVKRVTYTTSFDKMRGTFISIVILNNDLYCKVKVLHTTLVKLSGDVEKTPLFVM